MPFLALRFPGLPPFGIGVSEFDLLEIGLCRGLQKRPKGCLLHILEIAEKQPNFLPVCVGGSQARPAPLAVDGQVRAIVQILDVQLPPQFGVGERPPAQAKGDLEQVFAAGEDVTEPWAIARHLDLDSRAVVPVGRLEWTEGAYGLDEPDQHLGVPLGGDTLVIEVIDGVPGPAVALPGHLYVRPNLNGFNELQFQVRLATWIMNRSHLDRPSLEYGIQGGAGVGLCRAGDLLRSSLSDYVAAFIPGFGSQVDHPVGGLDHIEIVFDADAGVA